MAMAMIQVSSVTYALRGQKILRSMGIKAEIQRTTDKIQGKSCSYSILLPADKKTEAEKILTKYGIRMIGRSEKGGQ